MHDMKTSLQDNVLSNLERACDCMQSAVDDARRAMKSGDSAAAQQVMTKLAWGFANASTKIEGAFSTLNDLHAVEKMELQERLSAKSGPDNKEPETSTSKQ